MNATVQFPVRQLTIAPDFDGQRIDNFLRTHLKGVPKGHIYRLLRTGQVRVNKGRVKQGYRLKGGDIVRIPPLRETPAAVPIVGRGWEGKIARWTLFEDDHLLIIDKPSGLAVHGGSGLSFGIIEAVRAARPELRHLELAHRLDRDTSGCLVLVKRRSSLREFARGLREKRVKKTYLLLVRGRWDGAERMIDLPLRKNQMRSGERVVTADPDGKPARTRFMPRSIGDAASLIGARLITGRTHQIRVHAAAAGFPIAGDTKYGHATFNAEMREHGLSRLFLHASSIEFIHPHCGENLRVDAPLPDDLLVITNRLQLRP